MDTVLPAASRFLSALMFSRSAPGLRPDNQTNEKRIKRHLHHKLHLRKNACLSVLLLQKAFNLFPSLVQGLIHAGGGHGGWNLPAVVNRPTSLQHLHDESVRATDSDSCSQSQSRGCPDEQMAWQQWIL
ncbi:hypothetical protein IRJ41_019382 [Triplophysa rosa]|uniref:Uncharacterized protein n=1 Tax=Triplophysa rosa TaxID=992332 RepID=A0A9W7TPG5_TRIRA|nr:hypothetical protein IRJ41_019382 [Triplophysa rosa]